MNGTPNVHFEAVCDLLSKTEVISCIEESPDMGFYKDNYCARFLSFTTTLVGVMEVLRGAINNDRGKEIFPAVYEFCRLYQILIMYVDICSLFECLV